MKGHTSNQLHIKTPKTICKSMQIIASNHGNFHTVAQNSNGMDVKSNGMDSNGTDFFHVNNRYVVAC